MKSLSFLLIASSLLLACKPVAPPALEKETSSLSGDEDPIPEREVQSYANNCPAGTAPVQNNFNDPLGAFGSSNNCQPVFSAGPPKVQNSHVQRCLNVWHAKNVPLPSNPTWTELSGGVTVLGWGSGSNLNDRINTTPNRSIVLIKPSVSVLSSQTWNLMNPMGLYCIKSSTNVLSGITVNLAAGASLVESNVNVSVLSENPSGLAGVNVLSNIRVNTVGEAPMAPIQ